MQKESRDHHGHHREHHHHHYWKRFVSKLKRGMSKIKRALKKTLASFFKFLERIFKHYPPHHKFPVLRMSGTFRLEKERPYIISGVIHMAGIGKAVLNVTVTIPSGDVSSSTVETMDDGSFEMGFTALFPGDYTILVEYAGDALLLPSSATLVVNVAEVPVPVATTLTLAGPVDPVKVGDAVTITGMLSQ